ncbi:MAG: holo-ACP synthase [Microthrixaceae bacterium]
MSIVGVGLDVVDIGSFAEQLQVPGTRFVADGFSVGERGDAGDSPRRLAARYAAKEAFIKAWSSSRFGQPHLLDTWHLCDVEVVSDFVGRPVLRLHGAVLAAVNTQLGDQWRTHVSLSHDGEVAAAVVILESVGPDDVAVEGIDPGQVGLQLARMEVVSA